MIKLPVQTSNEVVDMEFIVVNAYSPLHGNSSETLASRYGNSLLDPTYEGEVPHNGRVEELVGSQIMARQCTVAAIKHYSTEMGSLSLNDAS